jgi:ElaB/YqjD/DUF883 family membrane-anchored ribosome-binding protein
MLLGPLTGYLSPGPLAADLGIETFLLGGNPPDRAAFCPIIIGDRAMAATETFNDMAQDAKEQITQLRAQVQTLMSERVTPALANAAGSAEEYARQAKDIASDQTEMLSEQVRESPIVAILIAAGAGYLLGRIAR